MRVEVLQPQHDLPLAEELLSLQHRSYAIEAVLIGDDRIPPLRESVVDLQRHALDWVGVRDGRNTVVGAAAFQEDVRVLDIHRLVVDPAVLRQGIGRLLVSWLIERAGSRTVTVSTGRDNTPARRLYEQLGFLRVDDEEAVPGLWVTRYERRRPAAQIEVATRAPG